MTFLIQVVFQILEPIIYTISFLSRTCHLWQNRDNFFCQIIVVFEKFRANHFAIWLSFVILTQICCHFAVIAQIGQFGAQVFNRKFGFSDVLLQCLTWNFIILHSWVPPFPAWNFSHFESEIQVHCTQLYRQK